MKIFILHVFSYSLRAPPSRVVLLHRKIAKCTCCFHKDHKTSGYWFTKMVLSLITTDARTAAFAVGNFFTRLIKNPVTRITKKYFAIGILVACTYRLTHRPIRDVKGQQFIILALSSRVETNKFQDVISKCKQFKARFMKLSLALQQTLLQNECTCLMPTIWLENDYWGVLVEEVFTAFWNGKYTCDQCNLTGRIGLVMRELSNTAR